MSGGIIIAGIGPGKPDWIAPGVIRALERMDVILGYKTYLRQIEAILPDIPREDSGMHHEIERAEKAVDLAVQGKNVGMVSGGDAGIYGMAGLVFEIMEKCGLHTIPVEVLPGITALNAAAALLGAPLMNDFAVISLSDYLTPLEVILKRIDAAIAGDFVIGLYNPKSHQRVLPFERACERLLEKLGGERPVGVVRAAYRKEQEVHRIELKDLPAFQVGMDCIIIVGNSTTRFMGGKMVTSRGYRITKD